eukprot:TRINITY_DN92410_c0_g1_i1.p1 TRINITY_DN92410_c0_g1~~TRINITY_DN92410_c0_g1_i1.p1  ORF type:complete len:500 (+),score=67.06 TRINITY_DN92410_c0_g1_i1:109-1608(+)
MVLSALRTPNFAAAEEEQFRKTLEPDLLNSIQGGCIVTGLLFTYFWSTFLWGSRWSANPCIRSMNSVLSATTVVICSLLLTASFLRQRFQVLSAVSWELVGVILSMAIATAASIDHRASSQWCEEPLPEFNHDAYSMQDLYVATVIAAFLTNCLNARVRYLRWVLLYLIAIQIAKSVALEKLSGLIFYKATFLSFLGLTYRGALRHEYHLREKFEAIVTVTNQECQLTSQYQAACAIVRKICDCLVEVTSNLDIVQAGQPFQAMLFLQTGTLSGRNLREFCAPGQELNLANKEGTCEMTTVRMRTADDSEFSVALYYVKFHINGRDRYLLGFVEEQEQNPRDSFSLPTPVKGLQIQGPRENSDTDSHSEILDEDAYVVCAIDRDVPIRVYSRTFSRYVAGSLAEGTSLSNCLGPKENVDGLLVEAARFAKEILEVPSQTVQMSSSSGENFKAKASIKGITFADEVTVRIGLDHIRKQRHRAVSRSRVEPQSIGRGAQSL